MTVHEKLDYLMGNGIGGNPRFITLLSGQYIAAGSSATRTYTNTNYDKVLMVGFAKSSGTWSADGTYEFIGDSTGGDNNSTYTILVSKGDTASLKFSATEYSSNTVAVIAI